VLSPLEEPPRVELLHRAALQRSGRAVLAADPRTAIQFLSEGFGVRDCQMGVVDGEDRWWRRMLSDTSRSAAKT
jgi:hypothetical protein